MCRNHSPNDPNHEWPEARCGRPNVVIGKNPSFADSSDRRLRKTARQDDAPARVQAATLSSHSSSVFASTFALLGSRNGHPKKRPANGRPTRPAPDAEFAGRFVDWHEGFDVDDFKQPGDLYRLMSDDQKQQLIDAIVGSMKNIPRRIQEKQCALFARCDPDYGGRIAEGLGFKVALAAAS
jgi:catalase